MGANVMIFITLNCEHWILIKQSSLFLIQGAFPVEA